MVDVIDVEVTVDACLGFIIGHRECVAWFGIGVDID